MKEGEVSQEDFIRMLKMDQVACDACLCVVRWVGYLTPKRRGPFCSESLIAFPYGHLVGINV